MNRWKPCLTLVAMIAIVMGFWTTGCGQDTPPGPKDAPAQAEPQAQPGEQPDAGGGEEPPKEIDWDKMFTADLSTGAQFTFEPQGSLPILLSNIWWDIRITDEATPDLKLADNKMPFTRSSQAIAAKVWKQEDLPEDAPPGLYVRLIVSAALNRAVYAEHVFIETNSKTQPFIKVEVKAPVDPFLFLKKMTFYHRNAGEESQQIAKLINEYIAPSKKDLVEIKDAGDIEVFKELKDIEAKLKIPSGHFHYLVLEGENGVMKYAVGAKPIAQMLNLFAQHIQLAEGGAASAKPILTLVYDSSYLSQKTLFETVKSEMDGKFGEQVVLNGLNLNDGKYKALDQEARLTAWAKESKAAEQEGYPADAKTPVWIVTAPGGATQEFLSGDQPFEKLENKLKALLGSSESESFKNKVEKAPE